MPPKQNSDFCLGCKAKFSLFKRRRHYCKHCGRPFCQNCLKNEHIVTAFSNKKLKLCNDCFVHVLVQQNESSLLNGLSAKILKHYLEQFSVPFSDCVEKRDLVERVQAVRISEQTGLPYLVSPTNTFFQSLVRQRAAVSPDSDSTNDTSVSTNAPSVSTNPTSVSNEPSVPSPEPIPAPAGPATSEARPQTNNAASTPSHSNIRPRSWDPSPTTTSPTQRPRTMSSNNAPPAPSRSSSPQRPPTTTTVDPETGEVRTTVHARALHMDPVLPTLEELPSLTISQLKRALESQRVDYADCIEKRELQERLRDVIEEEMRAQEAIAQMEKEEEEAKKQQKTTSTTAEGKGLAPECGGDAAAQKPTRIGEPTSRAWPF